MDTFRNRPTVTIAVLAVLITAEAQEASADYVVDYYQFEYQPILQSLSIECKMLRGETAHTAAEAARAQLEKEGIFLADRDEEMNYVRDYKLGEYNVVVKLDIRPPCHHGYGGENHNAYLSVTINGTEKINIPFGYHADLNEYEMCSITIHGDGVIYYESQLDLFEYVFFESTYPFGKPA